MRIIINLVPPSKWVLVSLVLVEASCITQPPNQLAAVSPISPPVGQTFPPPPPAPKRVTSESDRRVDAYYKWLIKREYSDDHGPAPQAEYLERELAILKFKQLTLGRPPRPNREPLR